MKEFCTFKDERNRVCQRYAGHAGKHNFRRATSMERLKNQLDGVEKDIEAAPDFEMKIKLRQLALKLNLALQKEEKRMREMRERRTTKKPEPPSSGGLVPDFAANLKSLKGK